tara:strand:+ start:227 stop:406 length:180 start_codon:yes stop_codon:yes gene_type:complete
MKGRTCMLLVIIVLILTLLNWFILMEFFDDLNRKFSHLLGVFIGLYLYFRKNENTNLYA